MRHRTFAHDFPCAALFLQTQRLIPLELCNSKRCSFAITTPYLTMVLTCFHGIELLPLEGPRGSDLANRLGGWSLSISTSPLPLSWLCLKARSYLFLLSTCSGPPQHSRAFSELFQTTPKWKSFLTPFNSLVLYLHLFISSPLPVSVSLSLRQITIPTSKGGRKDQVTAANVSFHRNLLMCHLGGFLKPGTLCFITMCPYA